MKEEVWSDLKNNTKKKAARINKAACGTGEEAALNLQLTDLEQWNISLTGVRDAGFSENQIDSSNRTVTLSPTPPVPAASHVVTEESEVVEESTITNLLDFDAWTEAGPNHITSPLPQPSSTTNTHHEEVKVVLDSPSPAGPLKTTYAGHGITSYQTISAQRWVIRQSIRLNVQQGSF